MLHHIKNGRCSPKRSAATALHVVFLQHCVMLHFMMCWSALLILFSSTCTWSLYCAFSDERIARVGTMTEDRHGRERRDPIVNPTNVAVPLQTSPHHGITEIGEAYDIGLVRCPLGHRSLRAPLCSMDCSALTTITTS